MPCAWVHRPERPRRSRSARCCSDPVYERAVRPSRHGRRQSGTAAARRLKQPVARIVAEGRVEQFRHKLVILSSVRIQQRIPHPEIDREPPHLPRVRRAYLDIAPALWSRASVEASEKPHAMSLSRKSARTFPVLTPTIEAGGTPEASAGRSRYPCLRSSR
jgi:hypothetical protein